MLNLLGQAARFEPIKPYRQQGELATARPSDQEAIGSNLAQLLGHRAQQFVRACTAEPLIESGEVIDTQQEHIAATGQVLSA